jgi:signal peptidase II
MQRAGRSILSRLRVPIAFTIAGLLTVVLDQATKALVRTSMDPGHTIPLVDGVFHLTYVRNTGAAFGLMPGRLPLFIGIASFVLVAVTVYLWHVRPTSRFVVLALGLVAGGAVGNLIDRVVFGKVTDFFDPQVFPVFNIADSAIVVGTAVLVVWTLFTGESTPDVDASQADMSRVEGGEAT